MLPRTPTADRRERFPPGSPRVQATTGRPRQLRETPPCRSSGAPRRDPVPSARPARQDLRIRMPRGSGNTLRGRAGAHPAGAWAPSTLPHQADLHLGPAVRAHDRQELRGIETRSADEGAINLRLLAELRCIRRRHAATVKDAGLRGSFSVFAAKRLTDEPDDAVGLLPRCGAAGPNRPDRLIRDHERADLVSGQHRDPNFTLPGDHALSLLSVPLIQALAHAENWNEPVRK